MTLELFTATGALVGGLVAFLLSEQVLAGLFTVLLVYTAITMARRREPGRRVEPTEMGSLGRWTAWPRIATGRDGARQRRPRPRRTSAAMRSGTSGRASSAACSPASCRRSSASAAARQGPADEPVMGVPLRVATATSNLMIGITASASAIIYLLRGGIDPYVAGPTAVGVFLERRSGRGRPTASTSASCAGCSWSSCCSPPGDGREGAPDDDG